MKLLHELDTNHWDFSNPLYNLWNSECSITVYPHKQNNNTNYEKFLVQYEFNQAIVAVSYEWDDHAKEKLNHPLREFPEDNKTKKLYVWVTGMAELHWMLNII